MRGEGFVLLSSHLGDPARKPLTSAALRTLTERIHAATPDSRQQPLESSHLLALGYSRREAERIVLLLSQEQLLRQYLKRGEQESCFPLPRGAENYPHKLRRALGGESPGCLWYLGDPALLESPMVSLVGSRELRTDNLRFARAVGAQAAKRGFTLVSGNARGADQAAQESCLASGGRVISVVADSLCRHAPRDNLLYLSLDDFDAEFSAQRALARNRVIHALGGITFVAQSALETGGTWSGTRMNLQRNWSQVVVFRDESPAMRAFCSMGARAVTTAQLEEMPFAPEREPSLFDMV